MITRFIVATAVFVTAAVVGIGLHSPVAHAQPGSPSRIAVPVVPQALDVPPGHEVYFKGHAEGTQNFVCLPSPAGVSWRFVGPQATLFDSFKGGISQQLTTHFLSANPDESGVARPVWQHSIDTSQVWGRVAASSVDPNFVEPGAIPWLLLEAVGAETGPTGGSILARTAFIHRLNTSGGTAPTLGCVQSSDVGVVALVPYSADYFFYRPDRAN